MQKKKNVHKSEAEQNMLSTDNKKKGLTVSLDSLIANKTLSSPTWNPPLGEDKSEKPVGSHKGSSDHSPS